MKEELEYESDSDDDLITPGSTPAKGLIKPHKSTYKELQKNPTVDNAFFFGENKKDDGTNPRRFPSQQSWSLKAEEVLAAKGQAPDKRSKRDQLLDRIFGNGIQQ